MRNIQLNKTDLLVSIDVESLFMKVPIAEAVVLITELLSLELSGLGGLFFWRTFFYFDGKFYEQIDGAAMGSPLSPVAANLYMEHFEKMALKTSNLKPKMWFAT
uniref:Reverse transcriptase domain-containing protein n=1 Tax=Graphocephala atropunctata TaxID=36148 RepID=A0A1B6MI77_9HEMI